MEANYADAYRDLYEHHWWWRSREAFLLEFLRRRMPPGGYGSILDVGCGDGLFFPALLPFGTPSGVETDARLVRDDGPFRRLIHVGTLDTFVPDRPCGLLLMLDVLEHVADDEALLRQAVSLVRGDVVITVPAFPVLWTRHDDVNLHVRRYRRRELLAMASRAGVEVEMCRYFFHWTVPAKLAQRVLETMVPPPAHAIATAPSPLINRALYHLSRIEHRFSSSLGWLPGSSLILIGRSRTAAEWTAPR